MVFLFLLFRVMVATVRFMVVASPPVLVLKAALVAAAAMRMLMVFGAAVLQK